MPCHVTDETKLKAYIAPVNHNIILEDMLVDIPATATSSLRAPSELPEIFQRALSSWANYSSLELLVKTPICHLLLHLHYFHWQVSLFDSQLVPPCVLAFLQVSKSFSHVLYWQVQQDMQPLHLHCWAIWWLFGLRFSFWAVFVIVAILPIMKLLTCKNNCFSWVDLQWKVHHGW